MSNNFSIANRMQKLAMLKRGKNGESGESAPKYDDLDALVAEDASPDEPLTAFSNEAELDEDLRAFAAFSDEDETDFAPEVGAVDDSLNEQALTDADNASVSEPSAQIPVSDTPYAEDANEGSLDDYFAALGIEATQPELTDEKASIEEDQGDSMETVAEADTSVESGDDLDEIALNATDEHDTDSGGIRVKTEAGESLEAEIPDFTAAEVEAEILAREFDHEAQVAVISTPAEKAGETCVSVTFDESRSILLAHVSQQMSCSVDDVVVTALDWYLDALFGDEEKQPMEAAG